MSEANVQQLVVRVGNAEGLRRSPDKVTGKRPHNQARYLVNMVIEAAGDDIEKYTAEQILRAALFLGKGL